VNIVIINTALAARNEYKPLKRYTIMMQQDEQNSFKNELIRLVDGYTKHCEDEMDRDTIETVQKVLHAHANGLEDEIQDIERTRLRYRSRLLTFLLNIFTTNGDTVFSIKFNDNPLGFDIEVDMSWNDNTATEIHESVTENDDPILIRAMDMFRISINQATSIISFIPYSSS